MFGRRKCFAMNSALIFLGVCSILLPTNWIVEGLSDYRLCADPQCQSIISMASGKISYPAGEEGMVSFKINSKIRVKSKSAGKDPSLWGIEVNGREGYAPKEYILENKVLIKDKYLVHTVPVLLHGLQKRPSTAPPTPAPINPSENIQMKNEDVEITTTAPLIEQVESKQTIPLTYPDKEPTKDELKQATPVLSEIQIIDGTAIPVVEKVVEKQNELKTNSNSDQTEIPEKHQFENSSETIEFEKQVLPLEQIVDENIRKQNTSISDETKVTESGSSTLDTVDDEGDVEDGENDYDEEENNSDEEDDSTIDGKDEEQALLEEREIKKESNDSKLLLVETDLLKAQNIMQAEEIDNLPRSEKINLQNSNEEKNKQNENEPPIQTSVDNTVVFNEIVDTEPATEQPVTEFVTLAQTLVPVQESISAEVQAAEVPALSTSNISEKYDKEVPNILANTTPLEAELQTNVSTESTTQSPSVTTVEKNVDDNALSVEHNVPTLPIFQTPSQYQPQDQYKQGHQHSNVHSHSQEHQYHSTNQHQHLGQSTPQNGIPEAPHETTANTENENRQESGVEEQHTSYNAKTIDEQILKQLPVEANSYETVTELSSNEIQSKNLQTVALSPDNHSKNNEFIDSVDNIVSVALKEEENRRKVEENGQIHHADASAVEENMSNKTPNLLGADTAENILPHSTPLSSIEATTPAPHPSSEEYETTSFEAYPAPQQYQTTTPASHPSSEVYETTTSAPQTPRDEYETTKLAQHPSSEEYETTTSAPHLAQHPSSEEYETTTSAPQTPRDEYETTKLAQHPSSEEYETTTSAPHLAQHPSSEEFETTTPAPHSPREEYETTKLAQHPSSEEYETTTSAPHLAQHPSSEESETTTSVPHSPREEYETTKSLPHNVPEEEIKDKEQGLFATILGTVNNFLSNGKKEDESMEDEELQRILYPDRIKANKNSKEADTDYCEKMSPNDCPSRVLRELNNAASTSSSITGCQLDLNNMSMDMLLTVAGNKMFEMSELLACLATVAVTCLFFLFVYYCFCNSSREGELLGKLNALERSLLATHKENAILKEDLMGTRNKLSCIEDNSFGSNDMVIALKKELEEELLEKHQLQEQVGNLEKELENAAEAGLELNKIVSELLNNQTGDESIISSVEELQKQLNEQQKTILDINANLAEKSRENSELQLMIAEQNTRLSGEIASLQQDNDELEVEKSNLQTRLEEMKREFEEDITKALEGKNFEIKRLQSELVELSTKLEAEHTKYQTSLAKVEALEECLRTVRRDPSVNINNVIDVANVRAELLDVQKRYAALKERLDTETDGKKLFEQQLQLASSENEKLKHDFHQSEKDKLEAQTRLEVLSNYFKEKETQLQKELSLKEAMWLKQQGETTSTVDRVTTMQEEIQALKSQNDALRAEIEAQLAAHKAQTGTLENRAHETWLAARQSERRYEEARAEATALRRKLTSLAGGAPGETNFEKMAAGELNSAPSPIHMESPGSPLLGRLPPPPFLPPPFMGPPPPFMGMPPPFVPPGEMRPPPLGRLMSPPPGAVSGGSGGSGHLPPPRSGRYSPNRTDYDDYDDDEDEDDYVDDEDDEDEEEVRMRQHHRRRGSDINGSWRRDDSYSPPPRAYRSQSPADSRYSYNAERDLISTYDTETDFEPSPRKRDRCGARGSRAGSYRDYSPPPSASSPLNVSSNSNAGKKHSASAFNKGHMSSGSEKSYNAPPPRHGGKKNSKSLV